MSSEIRTNLLKSRAGLSTVTLSDTGPVVTGIATFGVTTKIDGGNNVINVGTALTIGHTQGVQFHTQNLHSTGFEVNQVNVSGIASVGAAITMYGATGIISATKFLGDGSELTGISGVTINNNANNRVITGSGTANTLEAESTLTFNGADLEIQPAAAQPALFIGDSNRSGAGQGLVHFRGNWNGTTVARITIDTGDDTTNKDDGIIRFDTSSTGSLVERVRINRSGNLGIGNVTSPDDKVEIRTSTNDQGVLIKSTGSSSNAIKFDANRSGANQGLGSIKARWNGTTVAQIYMNTGDDTTDKNDGYIIFGTESAASNGNVNATERLRITSTGQLVVGNNPTVGSGNIVHIEAPTSFNSGETIVNIEGNNAAAAARIVLHNNNTGGSAYNEILGADAGGQSTSSIRFYNTDQSNNYGEIAFGTRSASGTPPVDRLRITSGGKLLVGATSGSNHHISSGSDTLNTVFQANLGGAGATCAIRVKMNTSANNGLQIQQNGSGTSIAGGAHAASIFNRENGKLRFGTNNSERLTIESNGHVYVQGQFTVKGELNMHSATTVAKYMDIGFQDNSFNMRRTNASDGGHSNFITVNASKVVSGNFNDTSDGKLKKNVATISDGAIEDIKKLRPVTFDWIDETENDNVSGFIAQEVKQVLPNLVDGTEYDPAYNDESLGSKGGIKSVGYSINSVGVTAHLTKAVQELIAKVEKLEQENTALRIRLTNLEDN